MNILWDFDGTLINTYPAYTRIVQQVLGKQVDEQEVYNQLKISYPHTIEFYGLTEKQIEEIDLLKAAIQPADVIPFVGVEDVLKFAKKNVIMTHKDRKGVEDILGYHGLRHYFADMVTIDDGYPRKPHTAAYEHLHNKHGIDLAIGDRTLDLIPAKKIGIQTCSFQNKKAEADHHLNSYSDFFTIFS